MIELASARISSIAPPEAFFAKWTDHATWSVWSPDSEWVRLDGPVAEGATGVIKPKGGPKTRFVISTLTPGREYTDTSRFPGARLTFQHLLTRVGDRTELDVRVTLAGPLAWIWARILGNGFRTSVPADLRRLVELVESEA
ncbi:MAG TPA: SRPBCC family protein [Mycobacteriales bacterium]|nr:SRPBCC family protein [Mycobacteriales bacterium]